MFARLKQYTLLVLICLQASKAVAESNSNFTSYVEVYRSLTYGIGVGQRYSAYFDQFFNMAVGTWTAIDKLSVFGPDGEPDPRIFESFCKSNRIVFSRTSKYTLRRQDGVRDHIHLTKTYIPIGGALFASQTNDNSFPIFHDLPDKEMIDLLKASNHTVSMLSITPNIIVIQSTTLSSSSTLILGRCVE